MKNYEEGKEVEILVTGYFMDSYCITFLAELCKVATFPKRKISHIPSLLNKKPVEYSNTLVENSTKNLVGTRYAKHEFVKINPRKVQATIKFYKN